nr:hypothetical protein [Tanacetum cinerariifolium]
QAHVGGVAIREPIAEATRPLHVVKSKGKAIATEEQATQSLLALHTPKRRTTTDQFIFQRRTPATEKASTGPSAQPHDDASTNIFCDSPSLADAETSGDTNNTNNGGDTEIMQIDPGKTPESRPPPERIFIEKDQAGPEPGLSHMALPGPDPEPMHDDFVASMYPQYFKDKPTKEEPNKENMETEVDSMVTVLIHQASSSAHPLSTPVVDLSPLKHVPSTTQAPICLATTTQTTTTLPPPPQHQSVSVSNLATRVTLEQVCASFEKRHTLQDNIVQGTSSRVFTLKLRDLPHKINQTVNEVVKEAEAFEASMERAIRDEFIAEKDKSRKRRRNDQDRPPPPPDSDLSKSRRHDSYASGSK